MFSQQALQNLKKGEKVVIPVQEDVGSFQQEGEDLLVFSTPVLENVEYISPSLRQYVERQLQDPYLQKAHLFVLFDEEKQAFFLEGIWDLAEIGVSDFSALVSQIRQVAEEIKFDIYKSLCQDLVYVIAKRSQNM